MSQTGIGAEPGFEGFVEGTAEGIAWPRGGRRRGGGRELALRTPGGRVRVRYVDVPDSDAAVVLLGGIGGGFDSPGADLYGRLMHELPRRRLGVARVRFRDPADLDGSTDDMLAALGFLEQLGIARAAVAGHSLGAAVALRAAARSRTVAAVAMLSAQTFGTEDVARLHGRPLLVVHGTHDAVLPAAGSVDLWDRAAEPRELHLLAGAGHALAEADGAVHDLLLRWLDRWMSPGRGPG